MRYPREIRDSLEKLRRLPVLTPRGARIVLFDVAELRITDGPPMLRSENALLAGFVYVDIRGPDLKSAVLDMQKAVAEQVKLTPGYSVSWSGQFEYLERATFSLTSRRFDEALVIRATLPFALIGGFCSCWAATQGQRHRALAVVVAEFGAIMLLYQKQAWEGPAGA